LSALHRACGVQTAPGVRLPAILQVNFFTTIIDFGFATGDYVASGNDGLQLISCLITNAVRCVPLQNKPALSEITNCQQFLAATITALAKLRVILALGRVAHDSVLRAAGAKRAAFPFAHGAEYQLNARRTGIRSITLIDSYHCSRYNTNTGVLTREMFRAVFSKVRERLRSPSGIPGG